MNKQVIPILFLILIGSFTTVLGQQAKIDSLESVINIIPEGDTARVRPLFDLGQKLLYSDANKARAIINELEEIGLKNRYPFALYASYKTKSDLLARIAKLDSATIANQKLIEMCIENDLDYYLNNAYYQKGVLLIRQNEYDSAIVLLQQIIKKIEDAGSNQNLLLGSKSAMATAMIRLGRYDEAIKQHQDCEKLYDEMGKRFELAKSKVNLGVAYQGYGRLQKALEKLMEALEVYNTLSGNDILYEKSKVYQNIANVYTSMEELEKSIKYSRISFNTKLAIKDSLGMGIALFNLAEGYKALCERKSRDKEPVNCDSLLVASLDTAVLALDIFEKVNDVWGIADISFLKAGISLYYNDFEKAIENYQVAQQFYEKINMFQRQANVLDQLSNLESKRKNYTKSKDYAQKEIVIANKIGSYQLLQSAYYNLALANRNLQEYDQMYDNLLEFMSYKDSLLNDSKQKAIVELETKYETEKKEQENRLLKQETELQQAQIAQRNLSLAGAVLGVLLLVGLVWQRSRTNKQLKEKNQVISKRNEEILEKNQDIEDLLQDAKHRIGNHLNTLKGLFTPSEETDLPAELYTEAQGRVTAITQLHHQLQNNDKEGDSAAYLQSLIRELETLFEWKEQQVIATKIASYKLDAEQLLSLGILVNELLSNTYKYAFQGVENPKVNVHFSKNGETYELVVSDNGVGFTQGVSPKGTGQGAKIIETFVEKIYGKMSWESEQGTTFRLVFS